MARPAMMKGSRKLPPQHLSIRVPWHDTGWDGRVCRDPRSNTSCLHLKSIAQLRDDETEDGCAGQSWGELPVEKLPPCVGERGGFLSPEALVSRKKEHPYKAMQGELYEHYEPTEMPLPPFSAACIPFRWMLRELVEPGQEGPGLAESLGLGYNVEREKELEARLEFKTQWAQDFTNQRILLDTFFGALAPERSLCFLYAKRTPLSEEGGRVLVGVGLVKNVGQPLEYAYSRQPRGDDLRNALWERNVAHSIRPEGFEGFVLPYQAILERATRDQSIDPREFVAFAPEEARAQFSYASEHVSNDHAIASLLAFIPVLERLRQVLPGGWDEHLRWIDVQLNRLWTMRGPFPGMGSALVAFGLERGTLIAWQIAALQAQQDSIWTESPWAIFDHVVRDPSLLGAEFKKDIGKDWSALWKRLPRERRALLELLSRFDLSAEQARRFYEPIVRQEAGIACSDAELLANPYLLYERDRRQADAITLESVDRGMCPDAVVSEHFPLPEPSALGDSADPRRLRAFVIETLEAAAVQGHTLQSSAQVILSLSRRALRPAVACTTDTLAILAPEMAPEVVPCEVEGSGQGLQLERYQQTGKMIHDAVSVRLRGKRHRALHDWRAKIDEELGGMPGAGPEQEQEERARQEKADALAELFASRFSVLIGPAGTGKTTLLRALCRLPEVSHGGVLLLAPTGKARVRLAASAQGFEARTLAQFLLDSRRYDPEMQRYQLQPGARKTRGARTVILDECSMLTEEALAATLEELDGVERLILVGDPRQLPPIGSGRPFVDVILHLDGSETGAERPGGAGSRRGLCKLTVVCRQRGGASEVGRDDVLLSSWFAGDAVDAGADEVWDRIAAGEAEGIKAIRWDTPEQLKERLLGALQGHLRLSSLEDEGGFERSLGATEFQGYRFFHPRGERDPEGAASRVEAWQILAPTRATEHGVEPLNRMLQEQFRSQVSAFARNRLAKIPVPFGPQGILYGDKVISVVNGMRRDVAPQVRASRYVANGDMGIVVGEYNRERQWKTSAGRNRLQVEFKSMPGSRIAYGPSDFGDEKSPPLELAYAITIHKAQGSEFGVTFVIIPSPCWLLSRELLYTALTRQTEQVVLLHQGPLHDLRVHGSEACSDIALRMTNLFRTPAPVEHRGRFLDEGLIHRTRNGELVRSKSELLIANILLDLGIQSYQYELPLVSSDGSTRYPDFTIDDAASGEKIYLEHLGMLSTPAYRKRWEKKLRWYRDQGILPVEEGGGENGTLITTSEERGFDEPSIRAHLRRALGRERA